MLLASWRLEDALISDFQLSATETSACCSHLPELCFRQVEKISPVLPSLRCLGWSGSHCVLESNVRLDMTYSIGGVGNHSFVLCVWHYTTFPGTRFATVLPASHWCLLVCSSMLVVQSTYCPYLLKPYVCKGIFSLPPHCSEQERSKRTCNSSCSFPFPVYYNHWQTHHFNIVNWKLPELRPEPCSCIAVPAGSWPKVVTTWAVLGPG